MPYEPGQHGQKLSLEPMHENVPAHLKHQLWTWVAVWINPRNASGVQRIRSIANHMRYDYSRALQYSMSTSPEYAMHDYIANRCSESDQQLGIIEFMLPTMNEGSLLQLEDILLIGNSAYAVSSDGKRLEWRATPEVKAQVEAVIAETGGSAGDHLTTAWNEAYGRTPDPAHSYGESIRAVEAALGPHVTPQNPKQTLGTMIADVRHAPQNFRFVVPDGHHSDGVQMVLSMMRQLWEGEAVRHGSSQPGPPQTPKEAKAAVHLAATLMEWAVSGAFGRR